MSEKTVEDERDELAVELLRTMDLTLYDAVDSFSYVMRAKLGRKLLEGRQGWAIEDDESWTLQTIRELLVAHVKKGDPVDVANFALFWWWHERIKLRQEANDGNHP